MDETQFIDRRTLVQINSTIIAGMLIFLTIGDFDNSTKLKEFIMIFVVLGFAFLIMSIISCFDTERSMKIPKTNKFKITKVSKYKLTMRFRGAETAFMFGICFLFLAVIVGLGSKLFLT
jgi:hypothetical protein